MLSNKSNYLIIKEFLHWAKFMNISDSTKITNKSSDINKKFKLNFSEATFVKALLESIPKDLRKLFTPTSPEDLEILEYRLIQFGKKQQERDQVMTIQKQFNIPLHPNMSLERVTTFAKISMLKEDKKNSYKENNYKDHPDRDSDGPNI